MINKLSIEVVLDNDDSRISCMHNYRITSNNSLVLDNDHDGAQ